MCLRTYSRILQEVATESGPGEVNVTRSWFKKEESFVCDVEETIDEINKFVGTDANFEYEDSVVKLMLLLN